MLLIFFIGTIRNYFKKKDKGFEIGSIIYESRIKRHRIKII